MDGLRAGAARAEVVEDGRVKRGDGGRMDCFLTREKLSGRLIPVANLMEPSRKSCSSCLKSQNGTLGQDEQDLQDA
jgi:hypothetical protein